MEKERCSLYHLREELVPKMSGSSLCSFLLGLEGWRRGMTLTICDKKFRHYILSSHEREHSFEKSRIHKIPEQARRICKHKELTREYLKEAHIPVPKGEYFDSHTPDEEILKAGQSIGFPLVLKPTSSSLGHGVITHITNQKNLKDSLIYVRQRLKLSRVLVEEHICGEDYRVYVIKGKIAGVIKRVPANVIGNGKETIETLIHTKNRSRKKNPYLSKGLIHIDEELKRFLEAKNLSLTSIPQENEQIFLTGKANASTGGDTIDATDRLPKEAKGLAIEALKSIPGLLYGGLDLILETTDSGLNVKIIEINSMAHLGMHIYPSQGLARDIPALLMDTFFPETIKNRRDVIEYRDIVFDVRRLLAPLREGVASKITLAPIPSGKLVARRYLLKKKTETQGYRRWIKKKALEYRLGGHIKRLGDGNYRLVVMGEETRVETFKEDLCNHQKYSTSFIEEKDWRHAIRVGFRIQ